MAFAQREEDREQERVPPACEDSDDHYESVTTDLCDIETFGTGPTRPKPTAAAVDPDFFSDGPVETNLQEGQSTSDRKLWRKRSHVKTVKGRLGVKEGKFVNIRKYFDWFTERGIYFMGVPYRF